MTVVIEHVRHRVREYPVQADPRLRGTDCGRYFLPSDVPVPVHEPATSRCEGCFR